MTFRDLPTVNAALNATAALLLLAGWWLIRRGRRDAHRLAKARDLPSARGLFLASVIYLPALNEIFRTEALSLEELGLCLLLSSGVFIGVEIEKFLIRRR